MDPLTIGTIAFLNYFSNKLIDWGFGKGFDLAFAEIMQRLTPENVAALEAEAQTLLPPTNREDIGVAVLIDEVEKATQANPQFKAAVEALGTEAQKNTELENAVRELTSTLKNQPHSIQNVAKIANTVEKVGVANVNTTIETQNNTTNFWLKSSERERTEVNPSKFIPYQGTSHFVGRSEELVKIHTQLYQHCGAVAISAVAGMGGVGKTELAVKYARTHENDYPGGVCWWEQCDFVG